jgi:RNA polymerase sigma-70 factor (ECF subfamily)
VDTLLEKLAGGETEAAERVFRDYAPFLRAMVRRRLTPRLRAKFDSADVVQSVWADVLDGLRHAEWQFSDHDRLRAFLARVTYNHFVNNCRRHSPALEREERLPDEASSALLERNQSPPSQVVQADELWETIMELCPPAHRELVKLRRQGLEVADLAERTGLHESSVRRIFYELAKRLAAVRERTSSARL